MLRTCYLTFDPSGTNLFHKINLSTYLPAGKGVADLPQFCCVFHTRVIFVKFRKSLRIRVRNLGTVIAVHRLTGGD